MLKVIGYSIVLVLIASLTMVIIIKSIDKEEVVTCTKLMNQAKDGYDGNFFITEWQKDMCQKHNIVIE